MPEIFFCQQVSVGLCKMQGRVWSEDRFANELPRFRKTSHSVGIARSSRSQSADRPKPDLPILIAGSWAGFGTMRPFSEGNWPLLASCCLTCLHERLNGS